MSRRPTTFWGKRPWTSRTTLSAAPLNATTNMRRANAHQRTGRAAGGKAQARLRRPCEDKRLGLPACASTLDEYLCAFALVSGRVHLQTHGPARRIRRRMKLNSKNLPVLMRLLLICAVVATLAWELLERLLAMGGVALNLSLGPVGFDIQVISIFLQVNPGTILGVVPAVILFRRL